MDFFWGYLLCSIAWWEYLNGWFFGVGWVDLFLVIDGVIEDENFWAGMSDQMEKTVTYPSLRLGGGMGFDVDG